MSGLPVLGAAKERFGPLRQLHARGLASAATGLVEYAGGVHGDPLLVGEHALDQVDAGPREQGAGSGVTHRESVVGHLRGETHVGAAATGFQADGAGVRFILVVKEHGRPVHAAVWARPDRQDLQSHGADSLGEVHRVAEPVVCEFWCHGQAEQDGRVEDVAECGSAGWGEELLTLHPGHDDALDPLLRACQASTGRRGGVGRGLEQPVHHDRVERRDPVCSGLESGTLTKEVPSVLPGNDHRGPGGHSPRTGASGPAVCACTPAHRRARPGRPGGRRAHRPVPVGAVSPNPWAPGGHTAPGQGAAGARGTGTPPTGGGGGVRTEARARALDELITGRWIVSFEADAQGKHTYFAVRPVGWSGLGDPFERVAEARAPSATPAPCPPRPPCARGRRNTVRASHGARVRWMGATRGVVTRVCATAPDGRPHPAVWRSPLEPRPPEGARPRGARPPGGPP